MALLVKSHQQMLVSSSTTSSSSPSSASQQRHPPPPPPPSSSCLTDQQQPSPAKRKRRPPGTPGSFNLIDLALCYMLMRAPPAVYIWLMRSIRVCCVPPCPAPSPACYLSTRVQTPMRRWWRCRRGRCWSRTGTCARSAGRGSSASRTCRCTGGGTRCRGAS
jgi:hypothetical protein